MNYVQNLILYKFSLIYVKIYLKTPRSRLVYLFVTGPTDTGLDTLTIQQDTGILLGVFYSLYFPMIGFFFMTPIP